MNDEELLSLGLSAKEIELFKIEKSKEQLAERKKLAERQKKKEEEKNKSGFLKGNSKSIRLLNGVAFWTAFYRLNPQRFVKDYLNITLKIFQEFLLYSMMVNKHFVYIASRG